MYEGKTILITGGTGSWGHELVKHLLHYEPREIRILSRNEYAQFRMQRAMNSQPLKFLIGDVRDERSVLEACQQVDYVFHLAALKHVTVCESQPDEAIKTNVQGTENVILASHKQGVKKMVYVSTDKAVDPINVYGMTKAISEKLVARANSRNSATKFVCIRSGNVLGTNGSVLPLFDQQLKRGEMITVTSKEMTRFFLLLPEAIRLLLTAVEASIGGEIYITKMNRCRITDLAKAMANLLQVKRVRFKEIGIKPGEKLHEVLISEHEASHTFEFDDQYYVIVPADAKAQVKKHYEHLKPFKQDGYRSNTDLLAINDIENMLKQGGFYT